jgi:hypothetical protein
VCADLPLGGCDQRRRNAAAAVLGAHGHVMKLRRISQRQVDVAERLIAFPSDEVEAVALMESCEPKHGHDALHLLRRKRPDQPPPSVTRTHSHRARQCLSRDRF